MLTHLLIVITAILGIIGGLILIAYLAEKKQRMINAILFMPFIIVIIYTFFNK
jgi:putative Ca2+/H+ antiporter (TMEM165/GDT1 family)